MDLSNALVDMQLAQPLNSINIPYVRQFRNYIIIYLVQVHNREK